jgi:ABC-type sugar transport system substrate-binding protein
MLNGKGNVLVTSVVSAGSEKEREIGFINEVKKFPGITFKTIPLFSAAIQKAGIPEDQILINALKENPDFDILFCLDQGFCEIAAAYLKSIGVKDKIISFDTSAKIIQYIKDGIVKVSYSQRQFVWGEKLVKWINDALNGKEVPKYEDTGMFEVNINNYKIFEKNFK